MLLLSCLLAVMTAFPADTAKTPAADKPVVSDREDIIPCFLEEPAPTFPGGEEALATYLKKNLKYPAAALKAQVGGTIFVQFIVDQTGLIRNVRTIGPYKGYGMEAEAVRVVSKMPKWKPVNMVGKYSEVLLHLPIRFVYPPHKPK
ncbi:TonB family protein [Chitinophaga sp. RAB17]